MEGLTAFLARVVPPRTPALVVRRAALIANIQAMQTACDAAGVALRPHGKMAKSSALARLQIAAGAIGLCCQTVGEAEAYARAGLGDLLLSAPVPSWGWPVLAGLAASGVRVGAVVDSEAQVAAAVAAGAMGVDLLVDVDGGQHRSGVGFAAAPRLAQQVRDAGFEWRGLQCYLGHLQADRSRAAAHAVATDRLRALVAALASAGLAPRVVTGGGTGTAPLDLAAGVFTELQAGSYALMDVQYGDAGAAFAPALFCAATVVSRQHKSHVTLDAGLKALSADGPAARLVAGAPEGSRFRFQGDEHGALLHPAALARLAEDGPAAVDALDADPAIPFPDWPAEGSLVWLQPGHVDPTVNLHDALFIADEEGRLECWPVDARREAMQWLA